MKSFHLKLLLFVSALVTAASAGAQWSPPPPLESVDLPAVNSRTIVTGTIVDVKPVGDDWSRRDVTVEVKETLKGDARGRALLRLRSFVQEQEFGRWIAGRDLMLIAIPPDPQSPASLIDLSSRDLAVFTADLKLLRQPDQVVQAVRDQVRRSHGASKVEPYTRRVPASRLTGTPLEKGTYVSHDKTFRLNVPVDRRLERYGQSLIRGKEANDRGEGIRVLGMFKSPGNIELIKARLRDNAWIPTWTYEDHKLFAYRFNDVRREAFRVLRSLGVFVPEPLTEEPTDLKLRVVSADLSGKGVSSDLAELAQYPNIVDLSLAGAKLDATSLEALGRLKGLKMLYLQGSNLSDDGLQSLGALPRLAYINLANTGVTDAGLQNLAKLKSLKKVDLGSGITDAGIAALRRRGPDIVVQPDEFAFLAPLHPRRVEMGFVGRSVMPSRGSLPEIWRYGLIFPKESAGQVDALLRRELLRRGWKTGNPEAIPSFDGYHRDRTRLPGRSQFPQLDTVLLANHRDGEADQLWDISSEVGGRLVIVGRIFR